VGGDPALQNEALLRGNDRSGSARLHDLEQSWLHRACQSTS